MAVRFLFRTAMLLLLVGGCGSASPTVETHATADAVTVAYGDEPDQFGELTVPSSAQDLPVVVLVHGGFWQQQFDLSLMDPLAEDLAARGYAVWNIEYRRVGVNGAGGWPETGDDVAAAIDHLEALVAIYPLDLGRVVLVGHSAGGHLALLSMQRTNAAVSPVAAIGLGAVVDPALFAEADRLLGGRPDEIPDVYASATPLLDADRMVLVQGEFDRIVTTSTLQSAQDAGVPVTVVENGNHFDLIDPSSRSWQATLEHLAMFVPVAN